MNESVNVNRSSDLGTNQPYTLTYTYTIPDTDLHRFTAAISVAASANPAATETTFTSGSVDVRR